MSISVQGRRPRTWLVASLALACGCGASNLPISSRFPPGKLTGEHDGVALEIREASYDAQQLELALVIRNGTTEAITVEPRGILLAYGTLVYPIVADAHAPVSNEVIAANGSVALKVVFVTGTELREPATVELRAVRVNERWLAPVTVEVPPMPARAD